MKILIDRKWKKESYTISKVYVDGEDFHCNCLEDTDRGLYQGMSTKDVLAVKEKGKTAIPRGTYHVIYTYSPRFKQRLPLLEFQSTHPRRVRRMILTVILLLDSFNPRTHVGCDDEYQYLVFQKYVSIHAPT